jgi:hypothetical protein
MHRLLIAALVLTAGCAQQRALSRYAPGDARDYFLSPRLQAITENQIERGEPRPILDGAGWVLGIPSKIVLWDRRIDNHRISPETEAAITEYLETNDLASVKVRLNQYAPRDEWRRLVANDAVNPGWRYTFGAVAWLEDVIFPGRLFGGDHYNPFTNTINIYSDVPAVGLHESGHAKDWARRKYKGTYAAVYAIPGAPLWHEAVASRDALAYVRAAGSPEEQEEAYRLLYPAYGTYVGGAVGDLVPGVGMIPYAGAVITGHIAGRIRGRYVARQTRATEAQQISRQPNEDMPNEDMPNEDMSNRQFDESISARGPEPLNRPVEH